MYRPHEAFISLLQRFETYPFLDEYTLILWKRKFAETIVQHSKVKFSNGKRHNYIILEIPSKHKLVLFLRTDC